MSALEITPCERRTGGSVFLEPSSDVSARASSEGVPTPMLKLFCKVHVYDWPWPCGEVIMRWMCLAKVMAPLHLMADMLWHTQADRGMRPHGWHGNVCTLISNAGYGLPSNKFYAAQNFAIHQQQAPAMKAAQLAWPVGSSSDTARKAQLGLGIQSQGACALIVFKIHPAFYILTHNADDLQGSLARRHCRSAQPCKEIVGQHSQFCLTLQDPLAVIHTLSKARTHKCQ
eukprot:scaffold196463_cov22-Tisochrysis_lutea.AAC.1